jgi:hypothetical protein
MAVDTSTVQITINVVDGNSGAVVSNVVKNLEGLGNAGAGSGKNVADGMDKIKGHSLSALDNVRLLRDDIGVRIPRSMEKAIASSQFLMSGIGAIGTGLLALGAIDIGVRIGKGLYDAYEKWISLDSAAKAYQDQVDKMKDEDFINVRDIETAKQRIDDATDSAKKFQQAAQDIHGAAWGTIFQSLATGNAAGVGAGAGMLVDARKMADQGYKNRSQADALKGPQAAEQHQAILSAIELSHAGDERLRGEQKITAEKDKQHAIDEENRKYEAGVEGLKGNKVPANAGQSRQHQLDAIADAKAEAQLYNLRREHSIELQHMQEAATEAGLRGSKLYEAQEAAAIDELKNKDMDSVAARNAIHLKFHNEEMRRLQDQTRETEKIERAASASGTSGIAKIQAEGANRVADINADEDLTPENRARRIAAANIETHQQMTAAEEDFTQHVNMLADESAGHQISGFARIRAEAQKQIDELQRSYEKLYGTNRNAPEYQAHQGELNRGIGSINAGANQQTADLARKNSDETAQLESEARAKYMSAEKQQTAAIETEYEERLQKFKEQLEQQEISEDDYNRRVAAAAQLRDAEMVENANRAREKMAGEFTSFFKSLDHPTEALKNLGDKVAGQAAAALVQRAQGRITGNATPSQITSPGDILGSVFDHIGGHRHAPGATPGAPGHAAVPEAASTKMISLATAEIHIQSANLNLGAGISAPGSGAGGPASSSGYNAAGPGLSFSSPGVGGSTSSLGARGSGGSTAATSAAVSPVPGIAGGSTSLLSVPGSAFNAPGGSTVSSAGGFGGGYASSGSTGGAGNTGASTQGGGGTFTGGAGSAPAGAVTAAKNPVGGALGDVQQGVGLLNQAKGIFGQGAAAGSAGSANADSSGGGLGDTGMPNLAGIFGGNKTTVTGPANNGMLGGGGVMGNLSGAAGGALGMYSAVEGNGGIGGALSGAMSGMKLGAALGGPIGAGIGAAAGAVVGAIGFGGREKARVYDLKSVRPRLGNDVDGFQQGSMDYTAAYSDMQALDTEARKTLDAMGGSARSYYWDTINGEIKQAEGKLTAEQRAGRSQMTATAAQYDIGTDRVPRDGLAVIHENERIMPSDQNERITRALESGADSPKMPVQGTSLGDVHLHVHAIDAKSSVQWLQANKHNVRAALNSSFAENSGEADA